MRPSDRGDDLVLAAPALKPGRRIDIPSVPNLRDIGGYPIPGAGRVRTGLLYRCAS